MVARCRYARAGDHNTVSYWWMSMTCSAALGRWDLATCNTENVLQPIRILDLRSIFINFTCECFDGGGGMRPPECRLLVLATHWVQIDSSSFIYSDSSNHVFHLIDAVALRPPRLSTTRHHWIIPTCLLTYLLTVPPPTRYKNHATRRRGRRRCGRRRLRLGG